MVRKQPPQKDWWWKCDTRVLSKSSSYVPLKEEAAHTLDGSSSVVLEGRAAGAFPVRTAKHPEGCCKPHQELTVLGT